jgi:hypothetical protein
MSVVGHVGSRTFERFATPRLIFVVGIILLVLLAEPLCFFDERLLFVIVEQSVRR